MIDAILALCFMLIGLTSEIMAFVNFSNKWFWYDMGVAAVSVWLGFVYKRKAMEG